MGANRTSGIKPALSGSRSHLQYQARTFVIRLALSLSGSHFQDQARTFAIRLARSQSISWFEFQYVAVYFFSQQIDETVGTLANVADSLLQLREERLAA